MNKVNDSSRDSNLKYKRGFLIKEEPVQSPMLNWNNLKIQDYYVYYDPSNKIGLTQDEDSWVMILGNIIDIENPQLDAIEISEKLLGYFQSDSNQFFDYLDESPGRYFVLFGTNLEANILADATGMRSIFYSKDNTIIASHCELIQEYIQSGPETKVRREWLSEYSNYHLPGHYTPYKNIFFLIPNTLLKLKDQSTKRFFPRRDLEENSAGFVVQEISRLVKAQLNKLVTLDKKLIFSLTAGIDSRSSLAFTREFKDKFLYFTYLKENSDLSSSSLQSFDIDKNVVQDMVNNLGLNHEFIKIDYKENRDLKDFVNVLKNNTFTRHNFRLADLYVSKFGEEYLHIRSNILEIGRAFYKSKYNLSKVMTVSDMVKCYSVKAMKDERVYKAFECYYKQVEMDRIFNYNPYDMLYWEYRMGTWHTQVLLESDVAHDTYILFNARKILKLLLSVPMAERLEHTIFKELIHSNWPVLNFWRINSLETLTDYYDQQFDDYGLSLKDIEIQGGSLVEENKDVIVNSLVQMKRVKIHMEDSAPKKGDYAVGNIPLKTVKNQVYSCVLQIRSPYENRKHAGRIKYQVLLNNKILLEEDISKWRESNQIKVTFKSDFDKNILSLRILAMKNCEDWSWGRAATLLIERVVLRLEKDDEKLGIIVSSPYSKVYDI